MIILTSSNASLEKSKFGCKQVEWLGYVIDEYSTVPMQRKTDAIVQLNHPKTFKQLKCFMGSIYHINKFIPNLAQLCTPLRPLLSNDNKYHFKWDNTHEPAFQNILDAVRNITKNCHFVSGRETRVVCDASRDGIGCALKQETPDGWATISYASRFLNSCENKYSVNELELLAVVWAIEHFKYYLYGRKFTLITDHQALVSALQCNKNNKTYQSRLTRWIDRLLPFDFDIKHLAGSKMGLIDYISRHPVGKPQPPAYWDEQFVVALIDDFIACLEFQDSASLNLALNSNPYGTFSTHKFDRNQNGSHSASFETANAFNLNSHKPTFSRSENCIQSKIPNFEPKISEKKVNHHATMNRQISHSASGMSLPPFQLIFRKCHKGAQTTISFQPKKTSRHLTLISNCTKT